MALWPRWAAPEAPFQPGKLAERLRGNDRRVARTSPCGSWRFGWPQASARRFAFGRSLKSAGLLPGSRSSAFLQRRRRTPAESAQRERPASIYVVDLTIATAEPITPDLLDAAASLGGGAAGTVGERRLQTILSVDADTAAAAIEQALDLLGLGASILAVAVMTEAEADRRLGDAPPFRAACDD